MSDTMTPRRLPRAAELTDTIIQFLHNDEESLADCSLVCKYWLPAARCHLFKELLLHPWNVEAFVNLVTHPSATIIPYIQSIAIDQFTFRHIELFEWMFLRLPRLESVRRLELHKIRWCNYRVEHLNNFVSVFQGITDIKLDRCAFQDSQHIQAAIASFPSLKRLVVINARFISRPHGPDVADVPRHTGPPTMIRELEFREINLMRILDWFISHHILVNSLSVDLGKVDYMGLRQYLRLLGPSLLFLQMDDFANMIAELFLERLDFSFNTHIQKLRFLNFNLRSQDTLSSTIPSVLAKITSSHLSEIECVYTLPEGRHFLSQLENDARSTTPGSMWRALDDVLSTFTSLRVVRFRLSPRQPDPLSFVGHIKRGLSSCNARGILSFENAIDEPEPPYLRSPFRSGMVSGPLCIAQMQDTVV